MTETTTAEVLYAGATPLDPATGEPTGDLVTILSPENLSTENRIFQKIDGVTWLFDVPSQRFLYGLIPQYSGNGWAIYNLETLSWDVHPERSTWIPPVLTGPDQPPPVWAFHYAGLGMRDTTSAEQRQKEWLMFAAAIAVGALVLARLKP